MASDDSMDVKEEAEESLIMIDSTRNPLPLKDPLALLENDPGIYDFTVFLGYVATPKNRWTYSEMLGKLFIVWDQVIPLEFKWNGTEQNLVVRALPLYTDPQHVNSPVLRCRIHAERNDPTNEGFYHVQHVIRSDNPGAVYEADPVTRTASVVVPLGELQPGTGTVTITYKFMCKSSCTTGMMRRPIVVLLNLERPNGEVIGRQSINVKVCSCPRRDMEKEEEMVKLNLLKVKREPKNKRNLFQIDLQFKSKDTFSKVLEFNHGITTSLLRTMDSGQPAHTELTYFLRFLESKMRVLT